MASMPISGGETKLHPTFDDYDYDVRNLMYLDYSPTISCVVVFVVVCLKCMQDAIDIRVLYGWALNTK